MTWTPLTSGQNNSDASALISCTTGLVSVGDVINVALTFGLDSTATDGVVEDNLGNVYARTSAVNDVSDVQRIETWKTIVTHAGTPTVQAQFNPTPGTSTGTFMSLAADPFSGSDSSSAADGTGSAQLQDTPTTATDATTSGTWATATDGDLIYTAAMCSATGADPGAPGTGFTLLQTVGTTVLKTAYKVQSTHSASTAGLWTAATNNAHITAAHAITPAGSGGGGGGSSTQRRTLGRGLMRGLMRGIR